MKRKQRTPRNYDGTELTSHQLHEVLSSVLSRVSEVYQDRPDLVLAAWPNIIGSELAEMTQAISFENGVLQVKVRNSSLYSLLSQRDKPKILTALRQQFPKIPIKNIFFRIG